MNDVLASIHTAAPEAVLTAGALLTLMIGVFRGDRSLVPLTWVCVLIFAIAGFSLLPASPSPVIAWGGLYVADAFSHFLKVLILGAAAISAVAALPYFGRSNSARFEYPVILMLSTLGMCMMVSANDMLTLYIGLELLSLAAYVLAAFHRNEARSSEAGLKYFLLGALASGILLYGISLVYGFAGSTSFTTLGETLRTGTPGIGVIFGLVFILAGLMFKISAVPFHMWTPDVYEGAPTPVAAFFASAPKAAAMGLLVRVCVEAFGGMTLDWRQIVSFVAIASMILGAVGAIGQTNIKRLLAYSSINNVGFALIGLAAGTRDGIAGVLFYMAVYLVMTLGSFLCVLQMRDANGDPVETLASLNGLSRSRKGLAAALAIFMFSLAGIPPLLGFWPKFAVFTAAIDARLYLLAVIGVVASVIGAYYYLRVIKSMYFDEPAPEFAASNSRVNGAMIGVAALFCSPLGMLAITPLVVAARNAAAALF
ncbi:NADH-quinone oxidoreductase subunit NuoN [Glacieibacterium sp.]|uniref:NADH-quinone oxidoreductase subunit NuoN n=1 Tax=Glacieibacterium sp. TaxID=2860237 RepID=UPI003B00BC86